MIKMILKLTPMNPLTGYPESATSCPFECYILSGILAALSTPYHLRVGSECLDMEMKK